MNSEITFIWDLDGTLLDSYDVIVDSLQQTYKEKGVEVSKKEIRKDVISHSVSFFILKIEEKYGVPFDDLKDRYSLISGDKIKNIKLMKHSIEILNYLKENGISSFVFTHRGKTTEGVLKNLGIFDYFADIVTSLNGFARKPSPEGLNYLIEKNHLDKDRTYYVGDRALDIECANNAGVKSILFLPDETIGRKTGKETFIVKDLLEIVDIIKQL